LCHGIEQEKAFNLAGFEVKKHTVHDYRPTLKAWYWNLARQVDEALQIVDVSTYNRFLTFFPVSFRFFDEGYARVHRLVLAKKS